MPKASSPNVCSLETCRLEMGVVRAVCVCGCVQVANWFVSNNKVTLRQNSSFQYLIVGANTEGIMLLQCNMACCTRAGQ